MPKLQPRFHQQLVPCFSSFMRFPAEPLRGISYSRFRRRLAKLAWPYSKSKILLEYDKSIGPVWWRFGEDLSCMPSERETLPIDAVEYALHVGANPEELVGLLPYVPPEAVLLAYGHLVTTHPFLRATDERLRWVYDSLTELGFPSAGIAEADARNFFKNVNDIHVHQLPTGLLHLRHLAGHFGWPFAVMRELQRRQRPLYRIWAVLRIRILGWRNERGRKLASPLRGI